MGPCIERSTSSPAPPGGPPPPRRHHPARRRVTPPQGSTPPGEAPLSGPHRARFQGSPAGVTPPPAGHPAVSRPPPRSPFYACLPGGAPVTSTGPAMSVWYGPLAQATQGQVVRNATLPASGRRQHQITSCSTHHPPHSPAGHALPSTGPLPEGPTDAARCPPHRQDQPGRASPSAAPGPPPATPPVEGRLPGGPPWKDPLPRGPPPGGPAWEDRPLRPP